MTYVECVKKLAYWLHIAQFLKYEQLIIRIITFANVHMLKIVVIV